MDIEARTALLLQLPANLRQAIASRHSAVTSHNPTSVGAIAVNSTAETLAHEVRQGIASIIRSTSLTQSLKGVATAGLAPSARYAAQKLLKMFRAAR